MAVPATSCAQVLLACPFAGDGVYALDPDNNFPVDVYCDQTTDGGGWTLVASTRTTTLNDEASPYYAADLATLEPATGHTGVWNGMRAQVPAGNSHDLRFTARNARGVTADPMTVDLSFYEVPWYTVITTGTDAQSCFSESDGSGNVLNPPPARRNNINGATLPLGDQWNEGFLEGEDVCGDTGDFTVDFDDRGMDSDQSDGTDWGEDDSSPKAGTTGVSDGQWFIFVRESVVAEPPVLTIAKTIQPGGEYYREGDTITYDYTVGNHASETIINIAANDDKLGSVSCPSTTLAPGASMTCTSLSHVATATDVHAL
eukprot:CAMPEP_0168580386 /NCGR_PEP_ID=MMETSP0420-20121227/767_1 /TAXON_ID=498008 /ORGANISM="Pessonella sp." /LENGTH=314 /DNA_ID=CAMNT_0008614495 /DNA_START=34 /DNA_END=979 /DNA_ORIENTATION=-